MADTVFSTTGAAPVFMVGGFAANAGPLPSNQTNPAQGAVVSSGGAMKLSGSGAALNAVLWDTGTDGALPYTVGLVQITGTYNASLTLQGTNDDGVNWVPLVFDPELASPTPPAAGVPNYAAGRFNTSGWARVRLVVNSYTSGTVVANAVLNAGPENPNRTPLPLATGTNQIGYLLAVRPYQDTLTPLATTGTFTGSARDSGSVTATNATWPYYTVQTFADQAGTLFTEGSWDGVTWYATNGTAGTAVALNTSVVVKVPGTFRYNRARYVNGATAQTKFALTSMYSQS